MYTRFPLRYVIPNAVTALNMALAGAAIVQGHAGQYVSAAWLIVWCVLLDRADGAIARLLNARSDFGGQFDSLADFLAFCVAPALVVYFFFSGDLRYKQLLEQSAYEIGLIVSTLIYVVAGGVRLARFNVTVVHAGPERFEGLSSTFAGFIVATFLLSSEQHMWPIEVFAATPILLLLCAAFMISNLTLPKSLGPHQRSLFPLLVIVHVVAYALGILRQFPAILLMLALAYPVLGFFSGAGSNRDIESSVPREDS